VSAPTGHPDWLRIDRQVSDPIIDHLVSPFTAPWHSPRIFLGDWHHLVLVGPADLHAGRDQLEVVWWTAPTVGHVVERENWHWLSAQRMEDTTAVLAPWAQFTLTRSAYGAGVDQRLLVSGMRHGGVRARHGRGEIILRRDEWSIASGGSVAAEADTVTSGLTQVSARATHTAWEVVVEAVDMAGVATTVGALNPHRNAWADTRTMMVPRQSLRVVAINRHTATITMDVTVIGVS
jgi:hypothetical protein